MQAKEKSTHKEFVCPYCGDNHFTRAGQSCPRCKENHVEEVDVDDETGEVVK